MATPGNVELPVLDLSILQQGTSQEQAAFCDALLDSCSKYGFVKLVNHGISEEYVSKVFDLVSQITSDSCEFRIC